MELRHLRYFVAVAEALNFTKASARLRVAQPALSRQVQALEDELGVDLLKRSPRGVTLTAEGRFFLEEARRILAMLKQSVDKVQALSRGEQGELHVGYAPSPTVEFLPQAVAAFQKIAPSVKLVLHDLSSNEIAEGLRHGSLDLGIMLRPTEANAVGLHFEPLIRYPLCAMLPAGHRMARLRTLTASQLAHEPIVTLNRELYTDYHRLMLSVFTKIGSKPNIAVECDSGSSMIAEVQAGRGVALQPAVYRHVAGKRVVLRPLRPGNLPAMDIVVSRARQGDFTPAAERFVRELHKVCT